MTAENQIKAFGQRVLRLEEEIKTLNADKSEIYKEAKSMGFDVKALKAAIGIWRKAVDDPLGAQERSAMVEMYLAALEGRQASKTLPAPSQGPGNGLPARTRTREGENTQNSDQISPAASSLAAQVEAGDAVDVSGVPASPAPIQQTAASGVSTGADGAPTKAETGDAAAGSEGSYSVKSSDPITFSPFEDVGEIPKFLDRRNQVAAHG